MFHKVVPDEDCDPIKYSSLIFFKKQFEVHHKSANYFLLYTLLLSTLSLTTLVTLTHSLYSVSKSISVQMLPSSEMKCTEYPYCGETIM
jgi:hypothetical protein